MALSSAPSASGLWLVVASVEVVRAGMQRWSLVFVSAVVSVLIVGSVFMSSAASTYGRCSFRTD